GGGAHPLVLPQRLLRLRRRNEARRMRSLAGHILTPQGFVDGTLEIDAAGRIARIDGTPVGEDAVREAAAPKLLPGFIDLHVHGGGGRDIMEGGDAAVRIA